MFSGLIFKFVQVYLHYRGGMVNTVGWKNLMVNSLLSKVGTSDVDKDM